VPLGKSASGSVIFSGTEINLATTTISLLSICSANVSATAEQNGQAEAVAADADGVVCQIGTNRSAATASAIAKRMTKAGIGRFPLGAIKRNVLPCRWLGKSQQNQKGSRKLLVVIWYRCDRKKENKHFQKISTFPTIKRQNVPLGDRLRDLLLGGLFAQ